MSLDIILALDRVFSTTIRSRFVMKTLMIDSGCFLEKEFYRIDLYESLNDIICNC